MDCQAAACHQLPLMRGKNSEYNCVFARVCVCEWMTCIPSVYTSIWVHWAVSGIKKWYSNTCWVCLQRNALLLLGLINWQQLAVGLFTFLTVNHNHTEKICPHKMSRTQSNTVRLLTCALSLSWCMSDNIVTLTRNIQICADRLLHWCDRCVLCVYQYLRAICRAEQSDSSLFSVILICSDSPFLLSRAAVRRSFLAFSLSMYLG